LPDVEQAAEGVGWSVLTARENGRIVFMFCAFEGRRNQKLIDYPVRTPNSLDRFLSASRPASHALARPPITRLVVARER